MSNHGIRYDREFQWGGIEGSACDDLVPEAVDKYLAEPADNFARRTGKAICSRCVVVDICRSNALDSTMLPKQGVIAGVSARELWNARSWRNYDTGVTDSPPQVPRPDWFTDFSEAADVVEHTRMLEEAGDA